MTNNLRFLSVENVLALQADTIAQEGGLHGVRDVGLLEAAVMMPQQQWGDIYLHVDLAAMAAAYHFHLAANHPFLDGNKRAAVLAALVFLDVNGVEDLPDPVELERITLEVAASQRNKEALTAWWREQLTSIELTPYNPDFAGQIEEAEMIMCDDRDVLRRLAE